MFSSCTVFLAIQSLLVYQRGMKEYQQEVVQGVSPVSILKINGDISNKTAHFPIRIVNRMDELTRPNNGKMLFIAPDNASLPGNYPNLYHAQDVVLPMNYRAGKVVKYYHRIFSNCNLSNV